MDDDEKRQQLEQWAGQHPNLCGDWKMFNLGAHGTSLVSCGLVKDHSNELIADEDTYCVDHVARKQMDDGSSVTFRWTS